MKTPLARYLELLAALTARVACADGAAICHALYDAWAEQVHGRSLPH